jgi:hypothetical protein
LSASTAALLAAPDSCERVKSDIQQRIINNGVPESGFHVSILCQTIRQTSPDAQVVGHCANDTFKILYTRTGSGAASGMQDNPAHKRAHLSEPQSLSRGHITLRLDED